MFLFYLISNLFLHIVYKLISQNHSHIVTYYCDSKVSGMVHLTPHVQDGAVIVFSQFAAMTLIDIQQLLVVLCVKNFCSCIKICFCSGIIATKTIEILQKSFVDTLSKARVFE